MAGLLDKAKEYLSEKVAEMEKPEATVTDVDLKDVSLECITYDAKVSVSNPYSVPIPICQITYTLKSSNSIGCFIWSNGWGTLSGSTTSSYRYVYTDKSDLASSETDESSNSDADLLVVLMICAIFAAKVLYPAETQRLWATLWPSPGSVLMLQVGVLDRKRSLQKTINEIAETANTSTTRGLKSMLNDVSIALLQHHDSFHYGHCFDQFEKDMESAKDCYMVLSEETREPFDTETFTNVDGGKWIWTALTNADSVDNEYTVVTIMILARGNYSIPSSRVDAAFSRVDAALQTFLSIPARKIKTVEVLWSPQREDETISKGQLRKYFPHMKFERIS